MGLLERFASEGIYFQAFMVAFGSLVVLRAPHQQNLSNEQIQAVPRWARWFLRIDQARLHRRGGWFIVAVSVTIIAVKLVNGDG